MPPAFRTFEISDPRYETENLREITVKSEALGGRADLTIHVPDAAAAARDLPLIILLHGVYGSHWAWARKAGAHRTAAKAQAEGVLPPCVLAMPSDGLWGDGSGYLPHRTQDFERWIVEEVPAAVRLAVPTVTTQSRCCIGGLSMGGFGALRLAAKFPERFVAAEGLSSITEFSQMHPFVAERPGSFTTVAEDHSVLDVMLRHRLRLPAIRFECGTGDPLIEANRTLHANLLGAGVAHEYAETAGGHDWNYWTERLPHLLAFFGASLRRGLRNC